MKYNSFTHHLHKVELCTWILPKVESVGSPKRNMKPNLEINNSYD